MWRMTLLSLVKSIWSSPYTLWPTPDGTYRLCTYFRKENSVIETDPYPIRRIDDLIDKLGMPNFVSKGHYIV